ncbi:MAG: hypothetical protein DCC71_15065 [Proteobacteria bacterium]|nr:MAG: hypothetical protein DCC71_15065 [Pseudomonadota bacterium]
MKLALVLVLCSPLPFAAAGCATCRPDRPPIEPSVEGRVGSGPAGYETETRVGFEVSNLFCRQPKRDEPADEERARAR